MSGGSWYLEAPGHGNGGRPLVANDVRKMHHHEHAALVKEIRAEWALLARAERIPHLARCRIITAPLHADRRSPQDVAACAPEVKAAVDGLVDAGVIDDDNPEHLTAIEFRHPLIVGRNGLAIRILQGDPA